MMTNKASKTGSKAKWEAPAIVTIDADLNNVKAAFSPGTDSLMFGSTTSMS